MRGKESILSHLYPGEELAPTYRFLNSDRENDSKMEVTQALEAFSQLALAFGSLSPGMEGLQDSIQKIRKAFGPQSKDPAKIDFLASDDLDLSDDLPNG